MPKKRTEIVLSEDQVEEALRLAHIRLKENRGGPDKTHASRRHQSWDVDVEGLLGEIAVATYLDTTINNDRHRADIGDDIEVRTTKYQRGRLLVQEKDNPDYRYVLVRGNIGHYELVGWCYGHEAQDPEYWDEKMKCYLVPNAILAPMSILQL